MASSAKADIEKEEDELNRSKGYAWETSKSNAWEQIKEDASGSLIAIRQTDQTTRKRRRPDTISGVRRGVIRFCAVILDLSDALKATDYKPTRAELAADAATAFIREFFDLNPLSHLCVLVTRDADVIRISPFSASHRIHIDAIQRAMRIGTRGSPSLQNALIAARKNLAAAPSYALREILVSFGSLSTCDPGDIHATIAQLANDRIRCSAVAMAAELHVLRALTTATDGTYVVALNEQHFRDALSNHVVPPPTTTRQVSASLIRMGFPSLRSLQTPAPFCNNPSVKGRLGYNCPRCTAWLSDMPAECTLCALTLVSSPHLARSYHHLFPVPTFFSLESFHPNNALPSHRTRPQVEAEVDTLRARKSLRCTGCSIVLRKDNNLILICPACLGTFCTDCDIFVHDSLHHCPGCGLQQTVTSVTS